LLQGLWVSIATLIVFIFSLWMNKDEIDSRTLTFTTLMFANLGLIVVNRAHLKRGDVLGTGGVWKKILEKGSSEHKLAWIFVGTLSVLAAIIYVPKLRDMFQFSILHPVDVLVCSVAGTSVLFLRGLGSLDRR